jgi:hypothetical protein
MNFKLDGMLSDIDPLIQICFEPDVWGDPEDKRGTLEWVREELEALGVVNDAVLDTAISRCAKGDSFHEVNLFDHIEALFNGLGFYTYNSDTWFEVYDAEAVTAEMLEEVE